LLFLAALLALFASSVLAYAQTTAGVELSITAGGQQGVLATISPIGETFSVSLGAAQVISGVELYRIDLGDAQLSDRVWIQILFLNPDEMGRVLNNPLAFIDVGVYYPGEGEGQVTLDIDGTIVIPDGGARARGVLSRVSGDILLFPTVPGQETLYILASIVVPAGPPPGQQPQILDKLRFSAAVRKF
jgi:hypothetical protein